VASFTVKRDPFFLVYAPVVHDHLAAIDAKYDSLRSTGNVGRCGSSPLE
jgi:hypothetical protein